MSDAARLQSMQDALNLLAGTCEASTTPGHRCWDDQWRFADLDWLADSWCNACIAQAGLTGKPLRFARPTIITALSEAVESGQWSQLVEAARLAGWFVRGGYHLAVDDPGCACLRDPLAGVPG